jgi:hypothetical protein
MKKTLLLACTFISFATISQAQITKGSALLGGSVGISRNSEETNSVESQTRNTYFSPTVGVAIKDNWVVGITTSFSRYESRPSSITYNHKMKYSSGGLFVRRYSSLGKSFYLYGDGAIRYNTHSNNQISGTDYETNYSSKGVGIYITPGLAYAVNKRLHLEASLNNLLSLSYSKNKTTNFTLSGHTTTEGKSFDFGTNFSNTIPLSIGFRFVLGK